MNNQYILDGHTAVVCDDLMKWAKWFETADRYVAKTTIGKTEVSTVFIGLDHSFGNGPPLLFKTMISGGDFDCEEWRYTTWEEAEKGHQKAVAKVEEKENDSKRNTIHET